MQLLDHSSSKVLTDLQKPFIRIRKPLPRGFESLDIEGGNRGSGQIRMAPRRETRLASQLPDQSPGSLCPEIGIKGI